MKKRSGAQALAVSLVDRPSLEPGLRNLAGEGRYARWKRDDPVTVIRTGSLLHVFVEGCYYTTGIDPEIAPGMCLDLRLTTNQ